MREITSRNTIRQTRESSIHNHSTTHRLRCTYTTLPLFLENGHYWKTRYHGSEDSDTEGDHHSARFSIRRYRFRTGSRLSSETGSTRPCSYLIKRFAGLGLRPGGKPTKRFSSSSLVAWKELKRPLMCVCVCVCGRVHHHAPSLRIAELPLVSPSLQKLRQLIGYFERLTLPYNCVMRYGKRGNRHREYSRYRGAH